MNALTVTAGAADHRAHIANAIRARGLATTTAAQYQREVDKALAAGVPLLDAAAVADYAATLSSSSRGFLRAALRCWTGRLRLEMKNSATPDNLAHVGATLHRLDALDQAVALETQRGTRAHVWLSAAEVRRLVATPAGRTAQRDRVVLALLVGAGLRRDELVSLAWTDVTRQGDRVVLSVTGKGDKGRVVPVSAALASILDAWRAVTGPDGLVVRGHAAGGGLTASLTAAQVYNITRRAGQRMGRPELAPHDLRRTYAQLGYENGVPLTQLSVLLGHADVATTQRYLNLELDLAVTASDFVPL